MNILYIAIDTSELSPQETPYEIKSYTDSGWSECRLLRISMKYNEDHRSDTLIKSNITDISNTPYHGITINMINKEGLDFSKFIDGIADVLNACDRIVCFNEKFILNCVKSELIRIHKTDIIDVIDGKYIYCLMKNHQRNTSGTSYYKLYELYNKEFGTNKTCSKSSMESLEYIHKLYEKLVKN